MFAAPSSIRFGAVELLPQPQNINTNHLLSCPRSLGPSINMISTDDLLFNPSLFVALPGKVIRITTKGINPPLVAPVNYSTSNNFIIGAFTSCLLTLSQGLASLTILSDPKPVTKPILIIGRKENQQSSEISEMNRSGCVYKLEELSETYQRKRKGKGTATEEPQKKKKVCDEETTEFIKTLKRSEYFVVD